METVISPVNTEDRRALDMRPGDTVRVWQKIEEKGKTRLQAFEGLVLARKHGTEAGATFTVRRVSGGIGVEKVFPLYSPMIDRIEVTRRAKVRRAKLYYIRKKVAREIKRQMRNMRMVTISTGASDANAPTGDGSVPEEEGGDVSDKSEEQAADVKAQQDTEEASEEAEDTKSSAEQAEPEEAEKK